MVRLFVFLYHLLPDPLQRLHELGVQVGDLRIKELCLDVVEVLEGVRCVPSVLVKDLWVVWVVPKRLLFLYTCWLVVSELRLWL
jgi:hypothetical protein